MPRDTLLHCTDEIDRFSQHQYARFPRRCQLTPSLLYTGIHKNAYPTPTKVSYSETAVLYLIEVMFVSVFVGFVLYGA